MLEIAKLRRTLGLITLASVVGLAVGGVSSYLVVRMVVLMLGPIFREGGEGFLPIFAAFLAGITGGLSVVVCSLPVANRASRKKVYVGLCLGIGLGWAYLWVANGGSFSSGSAPKGMVFWTVVVLVVACGLAGMIGGVIVDAKTLLMRKLQWRFSVRTLLTVISLIAVLLGLIVMLT